MMSQVFQEVVRDILGYIRISILTRHLEDRSHQFSIGSNERKPHVVHVDIFPEAACRNCATQEGDVLRRRSG